MNKDKRVCAEPFAEEHIMEEISGVLDAEDKLNDLARLYKAMGDPTRLKIMYSLAISPLCVCDIAILLDMTQSAISHHLRVLRDLKLVKFRREGKLVIYSLDDDHVLRIFEEGMDHIEHTRK